MLLELNRRQVIRRILFFTAFLLIAASAEVPRIIFDTDMDTDCDDAGAMAVLHALADRGECTILATVVSVRHPGALPTVAAINAYYGRRRSAHRRDQGRRRARVLALCG